MAGGGFQSAAEALQTGAQTHHSDSRRSDRIEEQRGWNTPKARNGFAWPYHGRRRTEQFIGNPQQRAGESRSELPCERRGAAPIAVNAGLGQQIEMRLLVAGERERTRRHSHLPQSSASFRQLPSNSFPRGVR